MYTYISVFKLIAEREMIVSRKPKWPRRNLRMRIRIYVYTGGNEKRLTIKYYYRRFHNISAHKKLHIELSVAGYVSRWPAVGVMFSAGL